MVKIIKVAEPCVGQREVNAVSKVVLSGSYVSGKKVHEFEDKFSEYIGTKYAVALNSGTAALHMALLVLGIGKGDEVIVPPLTFFSTISSVIYQNSIPVFADIDAKSYCISPPDIEDKISKKTKAIIPVHLYGNSADMDSIMNIAEKHNLKVIEDAAQAHGTEYKGKKVGSIGDIGIFSFFATKHMTTGEGGILVTNNKSWADLAKIIRNHGMTDRNTHKFLGFNYRMNEMAAAMGLVQLERLDRLNKQRIKNSLYLIKELNEKNILWLKTPSLERHIKHTFFWCPILIDEKKLGKTTKELIDLLRKKGIETRHRYWAPLYKQEIFSEKNALKYTNHTELLRYKGRYKGIYLENAENVIGKIIGLPNHPKLTKQNLDYIIKVLNDIK